MRSKIIKKAHKRDDFKLTSHNFLLCIRYEIFYDACKQAGFEPNIAIEMPHTSTMFSFVEENVGISLSFKKVYQEFENPKIKMISLTDDLHYPIALVYKKGKILHSIKKEFIEYCKEYF